MKITAAFLLVILSLLAVSCKNNTATQESDGGYKQRTDSNTTMPAAVEDNSQGAVAVDSVKNGQFNVSGIPDSAIKKKDSAGNK